MGQSEIESFEGRDNGNGIIASSVKTDLFELRGKAWYISAETPSDLLVHVEDFTFHLHKFPLHSRSGRISRITHESHDKVLNKITLDDLPGGCKAFELVARFCYGFSIDLTVANISGLRCAAEYLEMTEDMEEGNLIFKTEAFLSYMVLSSWKDSILVLNSCEKLFPWAENLQIVRRCSDSIASKACAKPEGIKWEYTATSMRVLTPVHNEIRDVSPSIDKTKTAPSDWWFEDISTLRIDHLVRAINAIKVKGMGYELVGAAIMHYASKWLPGLLKEGGTRQDEKGNIISWQRERHLIKSVSNEDSTNIYSRDHCMIIESLISIIPPQKDSVSCDFLLRLLRMANMLNVSPALVTELEKRVGMQFEQATLEHLLIPSYNKNQTFFDIDLVQRLLDHFLVQDHMENSYPHSQSQNQFENDIHEMTRRSIGSNHKMRVARLVDSYLTEVSKDRNLTLTKFQVLAEALPESARSCDDGLYRAIDSYLKAHPTLTEHDKKRICRVMDCQKLSIEACLHAAQNERLPLRVVVQVLFHEQQKITQAIAEKSVVEASDSLCQPMVCRRRTLLESAPTKFQEEWEKANRDIQSLKFELESMKAKYLELQNDIDTVQIQLDTKPKQKHTSPWSSGWKKLTKLTKSNYSQTLEADPQATTSAAEKTRKTPRRWRNSIS